MFKLRLGVNRVRNRRAAGLAVLGTIVATSFSVAQEPAWLKGDFRWKVSPPVIGPAERAGETCFSVKDPTVVKHDGKWRLFCMIRGQKRSHQIEYLWLADWSRAKDAQREVLSISDGYYCAPQ